MSNKHGSLYEEERKNRSRARADFGRATTFAASRTGLAGQTTPAALLLQYKFAQVFLVQHIIQPFPHVGPVNDDVLVVDVGTLETDVFQHPLQDGVQPAGADVLRGAVDLEGDVGQR